MTTKYLPNTVTVKIPFGTVKVTPGVLDDDARYAFTNGQCHAFALALQAVIGGDLVWGGVGQCTSHEYVDDPCPHDGVELPEALAQMFDADCPCQIDHVMVKIGHELFDIDGAWDEPTLLSDRFTDIGYLSNEEAEALGSLATWAIPNIDTASTFVESYLAWLDRPDLGYPTP